MTGRGGVSTADKSWSNMFTHTAFRPGWQYIPHINNVATGLQCFNSSAHAASLYSSYTVLAFLFLLDQNKRAGSSLQSRKYWMIYRGPWRLSRRRMIWLLPISPRPPNHSFSGFKQRRHRDDDSTSLLKGDFFRSFHYFIQHCFICRPSDSMHWVGGCGYRSRTVVTSALAVRRCNQSARSHLPQISSTSTVLRIAANLPSFRSYQNPARGGAAVARDRLLLCCTAPLLACASKIAMRFDDYSSYGMSLFF